MYGIAWYRCTGKDVSSWVVEWGELVSRKREEWIAEMQRRKEEKGEERDKRFRKEVWREEVRREEDRSLPREIAKQYFTGGRSIFQ